jgi:endogenous inhibitor of DNA gyrase (YacG/DUF329 family)
MLVVGMLCPICKKSVEESGPNRPKSFPFCCDRCKLIDLGRWLGGKYQIREPIDPSEQSWGSQSNEKER